MNEKMNDYLAKPVELGPLRDVVEKWLEKSAAPCTAAAQGQRTAEPSEIVFDAEGLLRRLMGDRQLACLVIKSFLDSAPTILNNLRSRLAEADVKGTLSLAHQLKGAAATVAAESLRAVVTAIESEGKAGHLDRCRDLLPRAFEQFECFRDATAD